MLWPVKGMLVSMVMVVLSSADDEIGRREVRVEDMDGRDLRSGERDDDVAMRDRAISVVGSGGRSEMGGEGVEFCCYEREREREKKRFGLGVVGNQGTIATTC